MDMNHSYLVLTTQENVPEVIAATSHPYTTLEAAPAHVQNQVVFIVFVFVFLPLQEKF